MFFFDFMKLNVDKTKNIISFHKNRLGSFLRGFKSYEYGFSNDADKL